MHAWRRVACALILIAAVGMAAASPRAETVTLFAAASTADAMGEAIALYNENENGSVRVSFAASSTLARQIENGAPADLYLSASLRWMDYLDARGLIVAASRRRLMGNRLVLVAPRDSTLDIVPAPGFRLAEALGEGRLAMGDPDHVPAGIYGRQALEALGVWERVEPRIARSGDVRAALALVARGEAVAGIAYATDAAISDAVRVVAEFPAGSHAPVSYEAALVAGQGGAAAERFLAFLTSGPARQVFRRHGFSLGE